MDVADTEDKVAAPAVFHHELRVPASAIDELGHVSNVEYVRWLQEIAVLHSNQVGLTWERCQELGGAFVVRRRTIDYLKPAELGQVLHLSTYVQRHTPMSAIRRTELRDAAGELMLKSETIWVYVSLETRRPARIPPEVIARFS